jgi:mRNA interferase MazF
MIRRGSIVWVDLNPVQGHEQRGSRPCVVITRDDALSLQRYPLLCVVPLTSTGVSGELYPRFTPSRINGLSNPSCALVDQVRAVDPLRVNRLVGFLAPNDLARLDKALQRLLLP